MKARLPIYIGTYAVKAGLPITEAVAFVTTYLTAPDKLAEIPGLTPDILAGAAKGSQWAYAESLQYVWLVNCRLVVE